MPPSPYRRAPHGARGLKHLSRKHSKLVCSRAPHGARGLKRFADDLIHLRKGRAPHGARGLKLSVLLIEIKTRQSRPAWGAWIETFLISS